MIPHDSGENPHGAAAERRRGVARVLQGLPSRGEEKPFLRIHPFGVTPRDTEEAVVEIGGSREETAPSPVGASRSSFLGIEVGGVVPTLLRNPGDAVPALG
ncbi:hypothetical protein GCM10027444_33880 [Actinopolyspora lacussalsi]